MHGPIYIISSTAYATIKWVTLFARWKKVDVSHTDVKMSKDSLKAFCEDSYFFVYFCVGQKTNMAPFVLRLLR